jgi:oligopeptide transport system substrate-binding protein
MTGQGKMHQDTLRRCLTVAALLGCLEGCGDPPNNPYPQADRHAQTLYTSFEERPKHLDPARAYSANEYEVIAQVVEPPLQYAYLKRPYALEPLAAAEYPKIFYLGARGERLPEGVSDAKILESVYEIRLRPGLRYAPHPAFAREPSGGFRYHALTPSALSKIHTLADFEERGTREVSAEDLAYQIKRLMHPEIHSPVAELMGEQIVGLKDLGSRLKEDWDQGPDRPQWLDLRRYAVAGLEIIDATTLRIHVHGKYPQFKFWLAMPFFAPSPWEAEAFFAQAGLKALNITPDWYPLGSGPYQLIENNPNRRMTLARNPHFHEATYPSEGEPQDAERGLLIDQGKRLPFIDRIVFVLEKETIPYWTKFLQGYYDASGLASDNFDQAVQFSSVGSAQLTPEMQEKNLHLETAITASIHYLGFNMLDPVVGGLTPAKAALRQAISLAIDEEEFIAIFMNGRGLAAQGPIPPGIFGFEEGEKGINPVLYDWEAGHPERKSLDVARARLAEAGYPGGLDPSTGKPLVLHLDTTLGGADDKPLLNWYRKQFQKLGIELVVRNTDYNQFQQKMAHGNAQLFRWGWNADYPDPENFLFLLYGENSKALHGGENAANYQSPEFDRLFLQMRNMDDGPERWAVIQKLLERVRLDAPWVFGIHPKSFSLHHDWYHNYKPNLMANNGLKYLRIDPDERARLRSLWNRPLYLPALVVGVLVFISGGFLRRLIHQRRGARGR